VDGVLIPARDPEKMAEAIISLLSDNETARRLATAGQAKIRSEYTLERMVERFDNLYRSLMEKKNVRNLRLGDG